MRYTFLGNTGLKVSELCPGAMTFGTEWGWGAGQVQIRVESAGVNFGETMQSAETYPLPLALPMTPGSEDFGTVAAIGAGVDQFAAGDRVAAMLTTSAGT